MHCNLLQELPMIVFEDQQFQQSWLDLAQIDLDEVTQLAKDRDITLPGRLSRAVDKRKLHFLAGRICAHDALLLQMNRDGIFDQQPSEIKRHDDGSPGWPEEYVGAITHCKNLAGAVISSTRTLSGIGLDAEMIMRPKTRKNVCKMITTPSELIRIENYGFSSEIAATLIFSIKESIFKCFYPLVKRYIGFQEVEIKELGLGSSTYSFVIQKDFNSQFRASTEYRGSFRIFDDYVVSNLKLPKF